MSVVFLITALVLMGLGGLVWKFKMVEILGSYDPRSCKDKDGLARWTGRNLLVAGGISLLFYFADLPKTHGKFALWLYLALIIGVLVMTALGARKYS